MDNSNTSNPSRGTKNRQDSRSEQNEQSTSNNAPKSISAIIGQSLAQESQEGVDRVFSQLNGYFTQGKDYVNENPKEAAALAISLGVAAWALTCTKPGRKMFEAGATMAVPRMAKWFTANFSGTKH